MAASLEQILGHAPLTESLRTQASGVPNPFPPELFTVKPTNKVLGDRAKYITISGERKLSKVVKYGASPILRALADVGDKPVRMLHMNEYFTIDVLMLQKLRSFEKYTQDEGLDYLRYQIEYAGKRHANTRIITAASMLRFGKIYIDSDNNILPNSTNADTDLTIDAGVPAGNLNQVGGIFSISWANPTADIQGHVRNLKQYALQLTGLPLTTAFYGINIPTYVQMNEHVQAFWSRNPQMHASFMQTNELPDNFLGIKKWVPVYSSFFESASGTNVEIWDDDQITFTPEVSQPDKMGWWAQYEGSYAIPRSLQPVKDAMGALAEYETVFGQFAYAVPDPKKPSFDVIHGDTHLPGLKNPNAVFMVDVTP